MIHKIGKYFKNILIAIDQFFNALFAGDPDETISSRMFKRSSEDQLAKSLCKVLDVVDEDHCEEAVEYDEGGDEI